MAQCGAIKLSTSYKLFNEDGQVVLKKAHAPPAVDEKLGEEEGTVREKNDAMAACRKYIGLLISYMKLQRWMKAPS